MFWCIVSLSIVTSCAVFDLPNRLVKIQITSENTQQYNTPKCPVSYLSSNCFFSAKSFYSFLAGKQSG